MPLTICICIRALKYNCLWQRPASELRFVATAQRSFISLISGSAKCSGVCYLFLSVAAKLLQAFENYLAYSFFVLHFD